MSPTLTVAESTEMPLSSFKDEVGTLNVNSEGTGGAMVWPSASAAKYPSDCCQWLRSDARKLEQDNL